MKFTRFRLLALASLALVVLIALLSIAARTSTAAPFDWRSDWEVESGFTLDIDTAGYHFPTAIAFVPHPGPDPQDPLYFVTELRGKVKVVTNDRSVYTFAEDFFQVKPPKELPELEGESGMAGICLDPKHGYVFVTFAYHDTEGVLRNNVMRLSSKPETFSLAATGQLAFTDIFAAYEGVPSHQIGNCQVDGNAVYVSMADGRQAALSQQVNSIFGKILRMSLDGEPLPDNPFYEDKSVKKAANYVWALGLRNPFGLKVVEGQLYAADNGSRIDRFLEVRTGENYLWDGNDWSIGANAKLVIAPAVGPVQVDYLPEGQSLFPERFQRHFFIAVSDPELAGVLTFPYSPNEHKVTDTPEYFVRYRGAETQIVAGVGVGPDGLYFAPIMPNAEGNSAIFKVEYAPAQEHPYVISSTSRPDSLMRDKGCFGCHSLNNNGGDAGPPLDRERLVASIQARLHAEAYLRTLPELDAMTREPFQSYRDERAQVQAAEGMEQVRLWTKYHIIEPRFDNPNSMMPNLGVSEQEALTITNYLLKEQEDPAEQFTTMLWSLVPVPILPRHLLMFFVGGFLVGAVMFAGVVWARQRLRRSRAGRGVSGGTAKQNIREIQFIAEPTDEVS